MRTELIRIGNSRGVRIPKPMIEEAGLSEKIELRVEIQRLIISPPRLPREGWEAAFREAEPSRQDELLLEGLPANEFDRKEWKW
jgi:antitoxin MazE